jgi:hypothetical protein
MQCHGFCITFKIKYKSSENFFFFFTFGGTTLAYTPRTLVLTTNSDLLFVILYLKTFINPRKGRILKIK